jgi:hypothetical protein
MPETILLIKKCKFKMGDITSELNRRRFSMARAADPEGKRTVGIITKCDALQTGDEQGVCAVEYERNEVAK